MPAIAAANVSAKPAMTTAPKAPPAMPPPTQRLRFGTPWVAAMTMPTIRAASSTSRKTMIAVASTPPLLLHDDDAAGRGMEIVKEHVAPALQRADIDADRASRRYHLFTMQRRALELGRDCLLVADRQFHLGAGRNFHLGRHKSVILDRNRDRAGIRRGREGAEQRKKDGKGKRAHLQKPAIDNRSQPIEGKPQPQPQFAQPECAKSPRAQNRRERAHPPVGKQCRLRISR